MVRLQEPEDESSLIFNETPLTELGVDTRKQLACMLNRKKVLRSEEGYERDWRGIAALAQQRSYVDEYANNPMELVLNSWAQHNPQTAKFGQLEQFLGIIDRWDVRDDIQENLIKDTQRFNAKQQQLAHAREHPPLAAREANNNQLGQEINLIGVQDVECLQQGLPLPTYNACVLYAEADIEHATEIMMKLEDPRYNFKLFLRHRDLLPGVLFEHVELAQLMATRCNHLIIVLTREFLNSPENTYLLNLTHKLQIDNKTRKIIPILYTYNLAIPLTLKLYTSITYAGQSSLYNFWDKLAKSLHDMDQLSIYSERKMQMPSAPPEDVKLPETPRILLNDNDVPDFENCKLPAAEPTLVQIAGDTSEPLPELKQKKKDKLLPKWTRNFSTSKSPLRHAHSISTINVVERERTLSASSSNISTTSESKKSSIKWRPKILKKVFARSSTKLQVPI